MAPTTIKSLNAPCKYFGIRIARLIAGGNVGQARHDAACYQAVNGRSWNVAESRAIAGACRYASKKWGAQVEFHQFIGL